MDYGTSEVMAGVYLAGPPPQQRYGSLENPNLPLNDPAVWETVFGDSFGTDTGIAVTAEKALMYAPFYRAVSLISGDVAKLPRPVYRRRPDIADGAREKDAGHRLNYILNTAANEETESVNFWGRFMEDALIWSCAYARIIFDGSGSPVELYNLLPDRTRPEYIDGRLWYVTEVSEPVPRLVPLFPWEVLRIEGPRPTGIMKPLFQMARNSISLGLAQERFASKFFRNGGRIGGILELPLGMPKPARDTIEEGFRKTYEGADNPFKTVILRDNAKFHAGQMSMRDSQMIEATEAQTRAIAHWFNLPPSKLGLSDSVSYNSKAEDNQNYLDTTLQIWLTRIESACNFRLISERQSSTHFIEHNVKNLLRMNPLAMAQMHQLQIASRIKNPNECRADINLLPYDGGEEFVNPNTMKSGNEPGEEPKDDPKEDKPKEGNLDLQQQTPWKVEYRSPDFLRALFATTHMARTKASEPQKFIAWVDGNLSRLRSLHKASKFPFDQVVSDLKAACELWDRDEFAVRVGEWCAILERNEQWNAE
jgi:HK97 family phage portal protein